MQVRKVAVVATGALATAAAMGSTPAFAADNAVVATPDTVAPATVGALGNEGVNRASDEAMRELTEQWLAVTPEQGWSAPWNQEPPQILSIGSGSAVSLAPWQICGSSAVAGLGLTVPVASPNTVLGDCVNGNIDLAGSDGEDALISILDNTAISALAWQICGSTAVAGVGGTVPIASPNTVTGDCVNGNIKIGDEGPEHTDNGEDGGHDGHKDEYPAYEAPKPGEKPDYPAYEDPAYKAPGHKAPAYEDPAYEAPKPAGQPDYPYHAHEAAAKAQPEGMGGSAPWNQEPPQILSAGSGSAVSALSWQPCGSSVVAGVGATVPVASPNSVLGDCVNGNIDINGQQSDALFSILDGSALSVAPWQVCGSSAVAGVGATVPIASPNTVTGDCVNGNIEID